MTVPGTVTHGRPLFCEGEAGVGKTALAHALAGVLGAPLLRLPCYAGIDAAQALYGWDFPRQLLHLRAAEAVDGAVDVERLENELYERRFLLARPLLAALESNPAGLLVDEVDPADEFEAFLLEVLSEFTITVPELGAIHDETRRSSGSPRTAAGRSPTRSTGAACTTGSSTRPLAARSRSCGSAYRPRAHGSPRRSRRRSTGCAKPTCGRRQGSRRRSTGPRLVALGVQTRYAATATAKLGAVLKCREDRQRAQRLDMAALVAAG